MSSAQLQPWNHLRFEVGVAEIHRASDNGAMLGLRIGRRLEPLGVARIELGSSYSTADENYLVVDAGVEARPLARYRITPILGVGSGFIVEPKFRGALLRGTLGLDLTVSERRALRIGAQVGYHGGERGPHMLFLGIETRR